MLEKFDVLEGLELLDELPVKVRVALAEKVNKEQVDPRQTCVGRAVTFTRVVDVAVAFRPATPPGVICANTEPIIKRRCNILYIYDTKSLVWDQPISISHHITLFHFTDAIVVMKKTCSTFVGA